MMESRRSASRAAFSVKVDAWAKAALAGGIADYEALLRQLPGVYPTELLASLDRLVAKRVIDPEVASSVRRQAVIPASNCAEGRSLLPLPHPLDFEWRFTPDASRTLLNQAASLTPAGGDLLLFGTPGLAVEALALPVGRRLAFLAEANCVTDRIVELNRVMGSALNIAFCNGGLPRESADAVLLDPPWYPDFVRPMLAAAAHACRPGGFVLVSLPPDGTRPTAEADRQASIALGRRLGLDLVKHTPLTIAYETPFFERNALWATGIGVPPKWRRGDLIVFRKVRAPTISAPKFSKRPRLWTEVLIGRMRMFIRTGDDAPTSTAALIPILAGDILPSVSRRDRRRSLAEVWTSGNRIFRTDNPQLLLEAAILCAGEEMGSGMRSGLWGNIRERETLERVAAELLDLAALEEAEEGDVPLAMDRSVGWRLSSPMSWSGLTATLSG